MKEDTLIRSAEFNPKVCVYWLISVTIVMLVTIFGIPLLLLWIPLGLWVTRKYLARMSCVLTERNLIVKKGMLVRVEKTIPLEKITDLGMVQGPIMRHFGLHTLTVETAGQSGQGALVSLTGIVDAENFRQEVLAQRDSFQDKGSANTPAPTNRESGSEIEVLNEIKSALLRIEDLLSKNKD